MISWLTDLLTAYQWVREERSGDVYTPPDLRGLPSLTCACGCDLFHAVIHFDDDRTVAGYFLDGTCVACDALVTLPTEIDDWEWTA